MEIKFDFDDILIQPVSITNIDSRNEINIEDKNNMLPLFTAPMFDVINENNVDDFLNNKIYGVLPRKILTEYTLEYLATCSPRKFISMGLVEFQKLFIESTLSDNVAINKFYILIDIANGHMSKLVDVIRKSKKKWGDRLVLMVGNIANPETYHILSDAGADFIRVGIGNGCFTPNMIVNTSLGKKMIKDIIKGDFVYTHTSELKEVINIITYIKNEEIMVINNIECTKNHEFYVIDIKYENIVNDDNYMQYAEWVSADKLDKNIHLLIELKLKYMKLKKIDKIETKHYEGNVHDLTVQNDHSYNINGVIVHNSGCLTTEQSSIGYPMASLIKDVHDVSLRINNPAKIIADGGMKKYADIIKALALGANYVMLGGIFNKALDSASPNYEFKDGLYFNDEEKNKLAYKEIDKEKAKIIFNKGGNVYKKFRGMSSKSVQQELGNEILKTSEGISTYNKVEYTLEGWVENFNHYLKSAMSYTGKRNLKDFIGRVDYNMISYNAFKRYNK